jgi:hypothetical protein
MSLYGPLLIPINILCIDTWQPCQHSDYLSDDLKNLSRLGSRLALID